MLNTAKPMNSLECQKLYKILFQSTKRQWNKLRSFKSKRVCIRSLHIRNDLTATSTTQFMERTIDRRIWRHISYRNAINMVPTNSEPQQIKRDGTTRDKRREENGNILTFQASKIPRLPKNCMDLAKCNQIVLQ